MTSTDGTSHLFAFGEFAAMYLSVWSNAVWTPLRDPREAGSPRPADARRRDGERRRGRTSSPRTSARRSTWRRAATPTCRRTARRSRNRRRPRRSATPSYVGYDEPGRRQLQGRRGQADHGRPALREASRGASRQAAARSGRGLTLFHDGLAKVRRVLANIPTYMMFDDHDFTDDWNLNPMWYDRVYTTSLGVTIGSQRARVATRCSRTGATIRIKYEKRDDYKKLLATIAQLFPTGRARARCRTPANDLDHAVRLRRAGRHGSGRPAAFPARNPIIKWHYSVPGPKHLAVAIDNRTRRSFVSRLGPPGNVEGSLDPDENTAQTEQIPAGPFTDGKEVLLVIAPLQVIGPPLLDELVAPAAYRVFDMVDVFGKKLDPNLKFGSRGMSGTNPDAIEAWAFDPVTLEALLQAPEAVRQRRAALRRRALQRQHRDELLHEGRGRSRALRAVHEQRLQERDAVVHHGDRPQPRARAPDRASAARRRAHGLVAQAVQSHRAGGRHERGGHSARVSREAQAGADAAADARLARRHDDQPGAASGLVVASGADLRPARRTTSARRRSSSASSPIAAGVRSRVDGSGRPRTRSKAFMPSPRDSSTRSRR